jgi:hypothetical protein
VERERHDESECPGCGCVLDREECERGHVVCAKCDERLERELAAYLTFVAVCRE